VQISAALRGLFRAPALVEASIENVFSYTVIQHPIWRRCGAALGVRLDWRALSRTAGCAHASHVGIVSSSARRQAGQSWQCHGPPELVMSSFTNQTLAQTEPEKGLYARRKSRGCISIRSTQLSDKQLAYRHSGAGAVQDRLVC
jgi:hypothetical protein